MLSLIATGTPSRGAASPAARPSPAPFTAPQPLLGPLRVRPRLLAQDDAVGIQLRLDPGDPLEIELHQLGRGDLLAADHLRDPRGAREGDLLLCGWHDAHAAILPHRRGSGFLAKTETRPTEKCSK